MRYGKFLQRMEHFCCRLQYRTVNAEYMDGIQVLNEGCGIGISNTPEKCLTTGMQKKM